MDYSFVETGGKSPGDTLSVPFPKRSRDEVFVMVDGVDVSSSLYEWVNDGLISILAGFPFGTKTRAERRTAIEGFESQQSGSSVYDWRGANNNFNQTLYILQEYADKENARNEIVNGIVGTIEDTQDLVEEAESIRDAAAGFRDQSRDWANTAYETDVPGQSPGSRSSFHYSEMARLSALNAASFETAYQGYLTTVSSYATTAAQWSSKAAEWATSMSLVSGSDYSAKYYANLARLQGGVPVGTVLQVYGNGTTTPPGYIKYVPGLAVTSAFPQLRAHGLSEGWATNGNGDPVLPNVESPFMRGWRSGQTGNDAGRAFGSVQQDAMQRIQGTYTTGRFAIPSTTGQTSGAFKEGPTVIGQNGSGNASAAQANIELDSALVTRTAAETRPVNITVTLFIKAYDAPIDAATLIAAQVVSDVASLKTEMPKKRPRGGRLSTSLTLSGLSILDVPFPAGVNDASDPNTVRRVILDLRNLTISASAQGPNLQLLDGSGNPVSTFYAGGVCAQAAGSTGGQAWPSTAALLDYSMTLGIPYDIVAEIISRFATNGMIKSQGHASSGTVRGFYSTGHYTVPDRISGIRLSLSSGTFTAGDLTMSWEYD